MEQEQQPIKRTEALRPLSRDHHDGLLLCWKIRTGLKQHIQLQRIINYLCYFFDQELKEHFREEEQILFALLPDNDLLKKEALAQHSSIYTMVSIFQEGKGDTDLLHRFADQLDHHIRFEERELFPYIENNTETTLLNKAGRVIERLHQGKKDLAWEDTFWQKKNDKACFQKLVNTQLEQPYISLQKQMKPQE